MEHAPLDYVPTEARYMDVGRDLRSPREKARGWLWASIISLAMWGGLIWLLWVIFGPTEAKAQSLCKPWPQVKKHFKDKFNEEPVSTGISGGKWIVQVIASPNGETFTIFMIDRLGIACAMISGQHWDPGKLAVKSETQL